MRNLVVVGASGHCKVVLDAVEKSDSFRVMGLLDAGGTPGAEWFGYRILGAEDRLPELVASENVESYVVAVGDNWTRRRIALSMESIAPGLPMAAVVHPSAQIARGARIEEGAVVLAGAVIGSDARVGRGCIVNTRASLDHDSVMEEFASLAPGVTVGGNVRIGVCSAVSIGAQVIHGVHIGNHTVIGAGATVLRDFPDHCMAWGTPARVIRGRDEGEKYL